MLPFGLTRARRGRLNIFLKFLTFSRYIDAIINVSLHMFGFLRLCCQVESNKLEACFAWICNGVEVDAENEQKHTQFKEALQKIEVQEASDLQLKSVYMI